MTDSAATTVTSWWENDLVQQWLIDVPISLGITLVVAIVAHWALRRLIDRLAESNIERKPRKKSHLLPISRQRDAEQQQEQTLSERAKERRRKSRVRTLAQVGKSAVGIIIWVWAALAILDKLGVNIAPLIASAGVAGVALGFGAQSVVKDFLAGIFMLLEDQYGVGDVIDVGDGIIGDVEDISLRLTTIRDMDGTLWYVRNGEILRVGNFADEYAIARLQIPVSLSNDPDEARKVIAAAAEEACEAPEVASKILDKPKMQGVSAFEIDHISYRISVTTMPGDQWDVQRHVQGHILARMHEEGIEVPYPHGIGIQHPSMEGDEA